VAATGHTAGTHRRGQLTRARMLAEALRLVDAEGVENLSMRKLGRACGIEAMSLYHHVPDKAAVLDGINEAVYEQVQLPELPAGTPWHDEVAAVVRAFRDALVAHPGVLPVVATRRPDFPAAHRLYERLGRVLLAAGFRPDDALYAVRSLAFFVIGFALAAVGRSALEPEKIGEGSGQARPPAVSAEDYPAYGALLAAVPADRWSWEELFELGLRSLLDGLCLRLDRAERPYADRT
jgi:TetR/AcrR family transcriptional regulator, tetracycline repressor protein